MSKPKILLQVTGSIAAFKAAALASNLVQDGSEVQAVLSDGARYFVGEATFEGLTGRPVLGDMFERGRALDHISLAEWADLLLLYPASANHITRLRAGLADDLIGCLFLANNFRKPYWVAPAMNSNMFAHPAVADAVQTLEDWGCRILPTGEGRMACGAVGYGRLLEPEKVAALIDQEIG
jgi:phosphopantothenoylcysteine decarboxylase/phosphopantothenate--cysteine ligase